MMLNGPILAVETTDISQWEPCVDFPFFFRKGNIGWIYPGSLLRCMPFKTRRKSWPTSTALSGLAVQKSVRWEMSQNTTGSERRKPWEYLFSHMLENYTDQLLQSCFVITKSKCLNFSGAMSYLCQETRTTQTQQEKQLHFQAISISLSASGPCSAQPSSRTITDYLVALVYTYVVLLNCTDPKKWQTWWWFHFRGQQKLEH